MVFELETSNSVYSISRYCTFIISSLLMSSSLLMMMMMHSSFQERELYIVHSCTLVNFLFDLEMFLTECDDDGEKVLNIARKLQKHFIKIDIFNVMC